MFRPKYGIVTIDWQDPTVDGVQRLRWTQAEIDARVDKNASYLDPETQKIMTPGECLPPADNDWRSFPIMYLGMTKDMHLAFVVVSKRTHTPIPGYRFQKEA